METIYRYIRSMQARGLTAETRRTATCILTGLAVHLSHLDPPVVLLDADRHHLADWQHARSQDISTASLRTQVSYVKVFYAWLLDEENIDVDPARRLRSPKVRRRLPRPISEEHLVDAFTAGDGRMVAILALGAFAGLRAMEIAGLNWSDVNLDGHEPTARVIGKGDKERLVDLSPELVAILRTLPHRRGPVIKRGDGKAGHNTANALSKAASRHLKALGLPDTLHALRSRLITWAVRFGGLRVGQEVAGHSSVSTTTGYAEVARREIRAVIIRAGKLQDTTTYPAA